MGNPKIILCDTNIIFDYFRGNQLMDEELNELGFARLAISSVTIAETYYGMRKKEERKTKEVLRKFNTFHLDTLISHKLLELMISYRSQHLKIPDGLIAATCLVNNLELFTFNRKDFDFIKGLKLYQPKRSFR